MLMGGRPHKNGQRVFRCYGAVNADGTKTKCPGLGKLSGQITTKVDADPLEGLVLNWMLDSLQDPALWAEYLAHADESLLRNGAAVDDLDAYQEAVNEMEAQLEYIDSRAITLAAERGPEAAAEWAAEKSAPIKANLEQAQSALDRIKDAQSWRKALENGLVGLMALEIDFSDQAREEWLEAEGHDLHAEALDSLQPDSDQWAHLLRQEAMSGLAGNGLSRWASEWTKHMANFLNVTVTLSERTDDDPVPEGWEDSPLGALPKVYVDFTPQAGVHNLAVSWARGDLNPHVLANTGT